MKIAFCLKRGVLQDLKIGDFSWKRVFYAFVVLEGEGGGGCLVFVVIVVFVQNPRKGGGGGSNFGTSMDVHFGRAWGVGAGLSEQFEIAEVHSPLTF